MGVVKHIACNIKNLFRLHCACVVLVEPNKRSCGPDVQYIPWRDEIVFLSRISKEPSETGSGIFVIILTLMYNLFPE